MARSLLDLKLQQSKLLEKFESDRYALTTSLLAAKNEIVELEMKLQELEAGLAARERDATTAIGDREVMQVHITRPRDSGWAGGQALSTYYLPSLLYRRPCLLEITTERCVVLSESEVRPYRMNSSYRREVG